MWWQQFSQEMDSGSCHRVWERHFMTHLPLGGEAMLAWRNKNDSFDFGPRSYMLEPRQWTNVPTIRETRKCLLACRRKMQSGRPVCDESQTWRSPCPWKGASILMALLPRPSSIPLVTSQDSHVAKKTKWLWSVWWETAHPSSMGQAVRSRSQYCAAARIRRFCRLLSGPRLER